MTTKSYKNCQSCGMPMKRDAKGGGTNADGSRSSAYCSHCYEAGEFTQPDITPAQMQALVKTKLREFGIPSFAGALMTRGIPKLQRWRG